MEKKTKKDYSITRRSQEAKRLYDSMTDEAASIYEKPVINKLERMDEIIGASFFFAFRCV